MPRPAQSATVPRLAILRGDVDERLKKVLKEIRARGRCQAHCSNASRRRPGTRALRNIDHVPYPEQPYLAAQQRNGGFLGRGRRST